MCLRFGYFTDIVLLNLGVELREDLSMQYRKAQWNIALSQSAVIIRPDKDDVFTASYVKWGLIPSWTKGKPKITPGNAKSETAATSGMFREALKRRRCLIPADGFYEWTGEKGCKQPHFISMADSQPFCFAGLWERWKADEQSDPLDTFTMLTTTPNEMMTPIHNRMPVILAREDYARWLDRNIGSAEVADLLKPYPPELMQEWLVSPKVNVAKNNDSPDLIERLVK